MQITEQEQNGISIFVLKGRADSDGSPVIEEVLGGAVDAGKSSMILELSGVNYMNSAALRVLADVLSANRANGGDLYLVGLAPKVFRVFQIIGFDAFFRIFDDVDAALNAFAGVS
jgi:anti-sigma B factor antagonist